MKNILSLVTITITSLMKLQMNYLFCNSKLELVDLSYNHLSTLDVIKVFKRLKNTLNLVAISVSYNMITDEAAETIATVLVQLLNLHFLTFLKTILHLKVYQDFECLRILCV